MQLLKRTALPFLKIKVIKNLHLFCEFVHGLIAIKEVFVYNKMEVMISG